MNQAPLDAYSASMDFILLTEDIVEQLPDEREYLAEEIRRAAAKIPVKIAAAACEPDPGTKALAYSEALRWATMAGAVLDICGFLELGSHAKRDRGSELLLCIGSLLTRVASTSGIKPGNPTLH